MKAVMSIGNPIKSDDNVGNVVLDMIDVDAIKIRAETMPENFIERMKGCDTIIIIDALEFGGRKGEVRLFDISDVEDRLMSTHSVPISLFKKFLPKAKILVIGIQPKSLEFGDELSENLKNNLESIAKNVKELIISS